MKYEIVMLEEKKVVGITARTGNNQLDMEQVINGLWNRFFAQGIFMAIKNPVNEKPIGLYTGYEGEQKQDYLTVVGREVTEAVEIPEHTAVITIPAGKYAKFIVTGNAIEEVRKLWAHLDEVGLDRVYGCDFEEYQNADMEHAEVHIYIEIR